MDIGTIAVVQALLLALALVLGLILLGLGISEISEGREARRRQIEAKLDRRQEELCATIFRLADALAEEKVAANHAQQDMIRAVYVAKGQLPPE